MILQEQSGAELDDDGCIDLDDLQAWLICNQDSNGAGFRLLPTPLGDLDPRLALSDLGCLKLNE